MLMVTKMNFFLHKVSTFALQITTSNTNYRITRTIADDCHIELSLVNDDMNILIRFYIFWLP